MRAVAVAVLLIASPAAAYCPAAGFDVDAVFPADGATGVAPDSAVVIPMLTDQHWCWESGWLDWPVWTIEVVQGGGAAVPGAPAYFNLAEHCASPTREIFAWRPDANLLPNTAYDVSVAFQDPGTSEHVLKTSFTTGTQVLPPIVVSGVPKVTVGRVVGEYQSCMQPDQCGGGGGCIKRRYEAVVAKISGLQISGGQEASGYDVVVTIGIDEPDSSWPKFVLEHVQAGEVIELERKVSDVHHPYAPCFTLLARDATGRQASSESRCLSSMDPASILARGVPETSSLAGGGCGCRQSPGSSTAAWWTCVLALALAHRRRAARPRLDARRGAQ